MRAYARRIGLVGAIAVASIVSGVDSLTEGYWGDELWTVRHATAPFLETVSGTVNRVHPPLYYLVVNGWVDIWGVSTHRRRL